MRLAGVACVNCSWSVRGQRRSRGDGDLPMMISLLSDFDNIYASRISEYVMPPATNTMSRWRLSLCVPAPLDALCQLGFWLRSDTAGWI